MVWTLTPDDIMKIEKVFTTSSKVPKEAEKKGNPVSHKFRIYNIFRAERWKFSIEFNFWYSQFQFMNNKNKFIICSIWHFTCNMREFALSKQTNDKTKGERQIQVPSI